MDRCKCEIVMRNYLVILKALSIYLLLSVIISFSLVAAEEQPRPGSRLKFLTYIKNAILRMYIQHTHIIYMNHKKKK